MKLETAVKLGTAGSSEARARFSTLAAMLLCSIAGACSDAEVVYEIVSFTASDSGVEGSFTASDSGEEGSFTASDSGVEGSFTASDSGEEGSFTASDSGEEGSFTASDSGEEGSFTAFDSGSEAEPEAGLRPVVSGGRDAGASSEAPSDAGVSDGDPEPTPDAGPSEAPDTGRSGTPDAAAPEPTDPGPTVITDNAHLDVLSIGYGEEELTLYIDHGRSQPLNPESAVIELRSVHQTLIPQSPDLSFLGAPGERVWHLDGGWSVRGVAAGLLVNDELTVHFETFEGPGVFGAWQFGVIEPQVHLSSVFALPQIFVLERTAHYHRNWSFTQPGVYTIGFFVSAVRASDRAELRTDSKEFTFRVVE